MKKLTVLSSAAVLAVVAFAAVAATPVQVVGEKVDSGLGDLPPYSQWADPTGKTVQVVGAKIDSGLGDLPPYSQWADPTGKNPMQARVADHTRALQVSQAK